MIPIILVALPLVGAGVLLLIPGRLGTIGALVGLAVDAGFVIGGSYGSGRLLGLPIRLAGDERVLLGAALLGTVALVAASDHKSVVAPASLLCLAAGTLAILLADDAAAAGLAIGVAVWCVLVISPMGSTAGDKTVSTEKYLTQTGLAIVALVMAGGLIQIYEIYSRPGFVGPAVALVVVGMATLTGVFPFHQWVPDIMTAQPRSAAVALGIAGICAGGVALGVVQNDQWLVEGSAVGLFLATIGLLAAIAAGILALGERRYRRAFALALSVASTVSLTGLAFGLGPGSAGAVVGFAADGLAAILGLLCLAAIDESDEALWQKVRAAAHQQRAAERPARIAHGLEGLLWRRPVLAAGLGVSLLTLAGVPPTAGFVSRWLILQAAVDRSPAFGIGVVAASLLALLALLRAFAPILAPVESRAVEPLQLADWASLFLIVLLLGFTLDPGPVLAVIIR